MPTHSTNLAWKVPRTEEPAWLQCMELQRVGQGLATKQQQQQSIKYLSSLQFSAVQFSCSVMSNSLWPNGLQHTRPPCSSPTPRVYSKSCPLSGWCHPNISSSVVPFFSCHQSFPASGSFLFSFFLYFYFLNFFPNYFISWRRITLQYCSGFCHTLTWISHGFTCVPHPEPPSHAPPHPIPLGHPSAPALSTCLMHPTWTGDLFHTW